LEIGDQAAERGRSRESLLGEIRERRAVAAQRRGFACVRERTRGAEADRDRARDRYDPSRTSPSSVWRRIRRHDRRDQLDETYVTTVLRDGVCKEIFACVREQCARVNDQRVCVMAVAEMAARRMSSGVHPAARRSRTPASRSDLLSFCVGDFMMSG
jgi:hypothetical protein